MTQVRPYRGIEAPQRLAERRGRLLDAGLELLGRTEHPSELTVRALCAEAGVSARYFYESFTDKDQLVAAVFDRVVSDIATATQAAVTSAPRCEQNRAGIAILVDTIARDARVGRLLFNAQLSNAVLARKRADLGGVFALLSSHHLITAHQLPDSEHVVALAHFVVGGVSQAISAWLAGDIRLEQEQLVDQLTQTLNDLAARASSAASPKLR